MGMSRLSAILTAGAAVSVLALSPAAPATAAPAAAHPDRVTAGGYHFQTFRPADVIAGSPDNDLVVTYTAGRALRDGTVSIAFPGGEWRSPLHVETGPLGNSPAYDQAVVVRPAPGNPPLPEQTIDPATACGWPAATPLSWAVRTVLGSQVIVVDHVTCAPGQQLFVRMNAVAAPARVGPHLLPVVTTEAGRAPRLTAAVVDVVPTPRVSLEVSAPSSLTAGAPFLVSVRAVRPDGSTATGYRGAIAIVSEDQEDCTLTPRDESVAYQFGPADAGFAVVQAQLDTSLAHRLRVYDIANKANPGVTDRFEVGGPPPAGGVICPVSYH
jgi:hypothetical protein